LWQNQVAVIGFEEKEKDLLYCTITVQQTGTDNFTAILSRVPLEEAQGMEEAVGA
jgi:hypothetical protein